MKDEIIQELWKAKDTIAAQHGYSVRRLAEHLRTLEKSSSSPTVDLRPKRRNDHREK